MPRSYISRIAGFSLLVALWVLMAAPVSAYDPDSHIERPPGQGPVYVTAMAGGGSLTDGDQARTGYAVNAIIRPHRAADFFNEFFAWNNALVLQVDKQGGGPAQILSADFIVRHYLADMRGLEGGRAFFVGLGTGISEAKWALPVEEPDVDPGHERANAFTFLAEVGLEWNLDPALVLVGKGQYRLYNRGGHDLSGWSLQAGAGLPFPF